jgi:hypothetical protein
MDAQSANAALRSLQLVLAASASAVLHHILAEPPDPSAFAALELAVSTILVMSQQWMNRTWIVRKGFQRVTQGGLVAVVVVAAVAAVAALVVLAAD